MSEAAPRNPELHNAHIAAANALNLAYASNPPLVEVGTPQELSHGFSKMKYKDGGMMNTVATPDAMIVDTGGGGAIESVSVKTAEPTGTYQTTDITSREGLDFSKLFTAVPSERRVDPGKVQITRPDGNGGTYKAEINSPERAEQAAAIIARRAAKRVGAAAVSRIVQNQSDSYRSLTAA